MTLKLSLEVGVCVCGCLSCLPLCGPVMDCRPVQGVPCLSPDHRWDRLQPPRDPTDGLSGYRKWMDDTPISHMITLKPLTEQYLELLIYSFSSSSLLSE